MKRNSKLACVLLAIALLLCLCACERDQATTGVGTTQSGQGTQPTESTTPSVPTTAPTGPSSAPTEPPTTPTQPAHVHEWLDATCVEPKKCATCGEVEGGLLAHTWDEGIVQKEATEETNGEILYTCTVCGETQTEMIDALDHAHDYANVVVVAPTCTEGGFTIHTCRCGDSYVSEETATIDHDYKDATCIAAKTCAVCGYTAGDPLGHIWDDGRVIREATEEADGEMLYTCTICAETMTQEIPSLEHVHSYSAVVAAATCTEGGYITHTCRCGDRYITDKTAALGHDWKTATCTDAKTCARCQETEGSANGHSWIDATCTQAKKCSICGQKDGDALEHDYLDATCTAPETCAACGHTTGNALGHSWDDGKVVREATEETDGEMLYTCTACSDTMTQEIPSLEHEHSYSEVVTAATCTEGGYTTCTCRCGDRYITDKTAALGHDWKAATCTEAKTCTRCQETEGSANGHSWIDATCTQAKKCSVCGKKDGDALGHDYESVVTPPSCTEEGYTTHTCSRCGRQYETDRVPTSEHDYMVEVIAPTCEAQGYTYHVCKNCGFDYVNDFTIGNHQYEVEQVITPTCTQQGFTIYTCIVCGDSYQDENVAALGHDYTDATCTEPKTCRRCGKISGNALAHSYGSWTVIQKPGCTQQGTERRTCIRCDAYETRQVNATGHSYSTQVTEPTCTEQGYTSHTCAFCGNSYKDSYVAALGHDWSDWEILVEPTTESEGRKERNCRVCSAKESTAIDRLPGPIYGTFQETLNVYEASNQEYYLNLAHYKELHWFAQVTYYTTHTDDQIEIHMIDLFKQAFGYTPNAPVTIENMGKYYIDGVDGVTVYKYAIKDYSVPLVFNEMYTVYEQICTDGVSPWVGFCIYGSDLDDHIAFAGTQEYAELADQMHKRFEEITGLSISYMRQHPEQFFIDGISIAGTVRTIDGKVFDALYIYCRSVQVNKHKLETIEGIWPTAYSDGLTQGERCSVCGTITVPQVTIPSYAAVYSDSYYYEQLGKEANGSALQQLYRMLDMAAMQFHFNTSIDLQNDEVAMFSYADLGLSTEDAIQVWVAYKNDHPLYYWISAWVQYSDSELFLLTEDDYTQGDVRAEYNDLIVEKVEEYMDIVSDETSDYRIALAFHDMILNSIDYAYESDGVTPEDELWAHRVLGVFDGRGVVCEGYAQAYQLLLNAAGVENIFVVGIAGIPGSGFGAHAWNLVQLDDGNWYWCDLTWDDRPNTQTGIIYNYFCVNDTQNVNLYNGVSMSVKYSFTDTHEVWIGIGKDYEWTILLPDRSESVFVK